MKKLSGTTVAYVGYVCALIGFLSLGLFVAAWALGSWWAAVAAGAAAAAFIAATLEFRVGGRREGGLWGKPVNLARYKATYRGGPVRPTRPRRWRARSAGS